MKKGEGKTSCISIKEDGKQCTRLGKHRNESGYFYCTQHSKIASKEKAITVHTIEPWTMIGLAEPLKSNGSKMIQKLRKRLFRGPKLDDPSGSIYIYFFEHERPLNYWKIGRTEGTVEKRKDQWSEEHGQEVTIYGEFKVKRNVRYIERIIHLYLAYCNMHRYPYELKFHSVWMLDPEEIIMDGQQNHSERLIAKNKHVEWFCEKIENILDIVKPVTETLELQKHHDKSNVIKTS